MGFLPAPARVETQGVTMNTKAEGAMEKIIKAAVERGASDLHIKAGDVFRARINGKLVPLTKQRLTPDQTRAIALKLITTEEDRARLDGCATSTAPGACPASGASGSTSCGSARRS